MAFDQRNFALMLARFAVGGVIGTQIARALVRREPSLLREVEALPLWQRIWRWRPWR